MWAGGVGGGGGTAVRRRLGGGGESERGEGDVQEALVSGDVRALVARETVLAAVADWEEAARRLRLYCRM